MKRMFSFSLTAKALALSLMIIVMSGFATRASHYAAADMHVDYVGTGPTDYTYKITLNLYKACEWGNADLPLVTTLNWKSASGCGISGLGDMTLLSIDTLDQLCDAFKSQNSCRSAASTFFPAFVRHTF